MAITIKGSPRRRARWLASSDMHSAQVECAAIPPCDA
jgi:hypothetical protein